MLKTWLRSWQCLILILSKSLWTDVFVRSLYCSVVALTKLCYIESQFLKLLTSTPFTRLLWLCWFGWLLYFFAWGPLKAFKILIISLWFSRKGNQYAAFAKLIWTLKMFYFILFLKELIISLGTSISLSARLLAWVPRFV